jgi:hypothetical protein
VSFEPPVSADVVVRPDQTDAIQRVIERIS